MTEAEKFPESSVTTASGMVAIVLPLKLTVIFFPDPNPTPFIVIAEPTWPVLGLIEKEGAVLIVEES